MDVQSDTCVLPHVCSGVPASSCSGCELRNHSQCSSPVHLTIQDSVRCLLKIKRVSLWAHFKVLKIYHLTLSI